MPTRRIILATIIAVTLGTASLASSHSPGHSSGVYMEFEP